MKFSFLKYLILILVNLLFILNEEKVQAGKFPIPSTIESNIGKFGFSYALFAGKSGGKISINEINSCQSITIKGCHETSRVYSFSLFITKNGKELVYTGSSSKLTSEMLEKLSTLKTGDEIEFARIKARNDKGMENYVKGMRFYVLR